MKLLIYSGLLYLLGVAILLTWKPELMFSKDGNWKEFGLGRHPDRYTWLPFWLFAILWAILSYTIILVLCGTSGEESVVSNQMSIAPANVSTKSLQPPSRKKPTTVDEMKPGYYILDANETIKQGIPKYVYLGPKTPQLIYHNQSLEEGMDNDGMDD